MGGWGVGPIAGRTGTSLPVGLSDSSVMLGAGSVGRQQESRAEAEDEGFVLGAGTPGAVCPATTWPLHAQAPEAPGR